MLNTWQILIEALAVLFLVLGAAYENKLIQFESNVKRIIIGNIKHFRRSLKK